MEDRDREISGIKTTAEPQIKSIGAQLHERNEALQAKEDVMQQQEKKYQGEINELLSLLDQKECLLKELEAAMAGAREQRKSQSQLLVSEKQTENELKAKIADLEKQLEAEEGIIEARDVEVSESKTKAAPQIQFLKHQLHERDDEIRDKESALQQQEESVQSEINHLREQISQKEGLLKEGEEAIDGVKKEAKSKGKLLESEKQTENELQEKLDDLQTHLEAQNGILEKREAELSTLKKKMKSQVQAFEAKSLARDEALKTKESAMQQQGERFQIDIGEMPAVLADSSQLLQVFQNLIDNAIHYRSDDPPRIRIEARELADAWQFSVHDNGVGFDPSFKEDIFTMFRRLYAEHELPGSGVGLAICKRILERHGGQIWAESEPGQGSCFYFTIAKTHIEPVSMQIPSSA